MEFIFVINYGIKLRKERRAGVLPLAIDKTNYDLNGERKRKGGFSFNIQ